MKKLFDDLYAAIISAARLATTVLVIATFIIVGFTLYDSSLTQDDFEEFKAEFEENIDTNFDELQDHMDGRFDALETLITNSTQQ